ncbi:hypothetical protein [Stratiformator vulcanicus]|uniref:Tetratricopeptide repeat protein n=1 Tax=Stratiformator vulcanicus TaxID=2527980 RepID=A0A517R5J9_9PLAN|nr:hypothetical protein [Stratiformator vulcanicus]QDT39176.1 hypothetical protein Pan189_35790 [Stratiformator vulcanicus]
MNDNRLAAAQAEHNRVLRQVMAADGYLELGMPAQAERELDQLGDCGELQPAVDFLFGQAFQKQSRFIEAIDRLQNAAESISAPFNRGAWAALGECFEAEGQHELAEVALMFAETSGIPDDWDDGDSASTASNFTEEAAFSEEMSFEGFNVEVDEFDSWQPAPQDEVGRGSRTNRLPKFDR